MAVYIKSDVPSWTPDQGIQSLSYPPSRDQTRPEAAPFLVNPTAILIFVAHVTCKLLREIIEKSLATISPLSFAMRQ